MRSNQIYIVILISLLTVSLLADDKIPLYSKFTSQSTKMSDIAKQEHFKEYSEKYRKLGLSPKGLNKAYYYRINLNKIDEYKKLGYELSRMAKRDFQGFGFDDIYMILGDKMFSKEVDLDKLYKEKGIINTIEYNCLLSPLIFTGTVIDSISPLPYPTGKYHTKYKVNINEILRGKYLLATQQAKEFNFYSEDGYIDLDSMDIDNNWREWSDKRIIYLDPNDGCSDGKVTKTYSIGDNILCFVWYINYDRYGESLYKRAEYSNLEINLLSVTSDTGLACFKFGNLSGDISDKEFNKYKTLINEIDRIANTEIFYELKFK